MHGLESRVLETVSAAGHVIPPYMIWAIKEHCVGFYGAGSRPATFSRSPSGYMDDDLRLDYIVKHFDVPAPPLMANLLPGVCLLWMDIALMLPGQ